MEKAKITHFTFQKVGKKQTAIFYNKTYISITSDIQKFINDFQNDYNRFKEHRNENIS